MYYKAAKLSFLTRNIIIGGVVSISTQHKQCISLLN